MATRTDVIAVSGRIDRLDDRVSADGSDSELVVVDYKTGRHLLTVDDARTSMALALYALAAERVMRRPCRSVELHHLPTGKVLAWEHTKESLARHLGRAESIAEEFAQADERYKWPQRLVASPGRRLPAPSQLWLWLVRLPRPLPRGQVGNRAAPIVGRSQRGGSERRSGGCRGRPLMILASDVSRTGRVSPFSRWRTRARACQGGHCPASPNA